MAAEKGSKFSELKQKFTDKVRQVRNLGLSDLGDDLGMRGIFVPEDEAVSPTVRTSDQKKGDSPKNN